jgi:hypothetical protein
MAVSNTYQAIATNTVAGLTTNSITFSSIPATYTDLVLVMSAKMLTTAADFGIQFNGDTGTNYSQTFLTGNGTNANSYRNSSTNKITPEYNASIRTGDYCVHIVNIQNYSNTTTYKTTLNRANSSTGSDAVVGLWRNTAAINSVYVFSDGGPYFAIGSTFTLYGIQAA